MTASVRLFTHSGMVALKVSNYSDQQSFSANFALKQPYLAREVIAAGASALSSGAALSASAHSKLLRVEVEPDKRVYYEVTPNGADARTADTSSPIIYGEDQIEWGPGWTISLLEAT